MTFRVGQKVVCVDASERILPLCGLRLGEVYTVRGYGPLEFECRGVLLVEIDSRFSDEFEDMGFFEDRFRPIVERKTELPASLTALLDPANHVPLKELA